MRDRRIESLRRSLQWLFENRATFLAPKPTWIKGIKRLAEIAMLADLMLTYRLPAIDPTFGEHANKWLDTGWKALRQGDFLIHCIDMDPRWVALAATYGPFHRHGRRNARFEARVRAAPDGVDPNAFVRLSAATAYARIGIPSTLDIDALVAEQWISRVSEYTLADPVRAYETTHVVFWLGELGRITPMIRDKLGAWSDRWVAHYQRARNVDIVAELIQMMHYVGAPTSEDIWTWFLDSQDEDGSFPAIELPTRALGRYHTTVVGAMALAICLGEAPCSCG